MNLEQMYYLVELERTDTLSQAAKNLSISQAGLSQSLAHLEEELGVKLFERYRSGTRLTKEGRVIIEHAKEILKQISLIKSESYSSHFQEETPLRFGITNEIPGSLLSLLLDFQNKHTDFRIFLKEDQSQCIIQDLRNDIYDIGLIVVNRDIQAQLSDLEFTSIAKGSFKLFTPRNHYLSQITDIRISPELMKEQEYALFIDEYIDDFVNLFEKRYGKLNIIVKSTSFKVVVEAMKKFNAVSIIRDIQLDRLLYKESHAELTSHDLSHIDKTQFQLGLIKKRDKTLSKLQENFIERVCKEL